MREEFPDLPEQAGDGAVLWDRLANRPVITLHPEYGQLMCICNELGNLDDALNSLSRRALESEGIQVK